jgi:hydroxymethylpyrimidine/phosphomethylpyrimidine kinase / thiaminase
MSPIRRDCNAFSPEGAHDLPQVMVSTSGAQLLPGDAVRILREKLLPMTTILTPNIPEAILLLRDADQHVKSPSSLEEAKLVAKQVHGLGPKAVLLKGGHLPLASDYTKSGSRDEAVLVVDILYDGSTYTLVEAEYSTSKNTHGTGCSLASAIAANMASGKDMVAAVRDSCRYVEAGIRTSKTLGKGNGPINHFHSAYHLPCAP